MATCLLTYQHLVQKNVLTDLFCRAILLSGHSFVGPFFCRAILLYLIINPAYANMCQNYVVR